MRPTSVTWLAAPLGEEGRGVEYHFVQLKLSAHGAVLCAEPLALGLALGRRRHWRAAVWVCVGHAPPKQVAHIISSGGSQLAYPPPPSAAGTKALSIQRGVLTALRASRIDGPENGAGEAPEV